MQIQEFATMEQAAATYPRLLASVQGPSNKDTRAMLNAGQLALRSEYYVRAK